MIALPFVGDIGLSTYSPANAIISKSCSVFCFFAITLYQCFQHVISLAVVIVCFMQFIHYCTIFLLCDKGHFVRFNVLLVGIMLNMYFVIFSLNFNYITKYVTFSLNVVVAVTAVNSPFTVTAFEMLLELFHLL